MPEIKVFNNVESAAPMIRAAVERAKNILLHLHPSPDQDSVGSALAFYHLLRVWGKAVTVISGDSPLPETFSILPGASAIKLASWKEIRPEDYNLFLILDSGAPQMISRLVQPLVFPPTMRTIAIDHHRSHAPYAEQTLLVPTAPATAAVLYDLFRVWGVTFTPEVAAGLLVGLYGDTGGFRYPLTTATTMAAVAELARAYPNFASLWYEFESLAPEDVAFDRLALSRLEIWNDGRVATTFVAQEDLLANQLPESAVGAGSFAAYLARVRAWPLAVVAVEAAPRQIRVSLRSRVADYDVALAAAALGGGGHRAAAGAFVTDRSFTEVKECLRETITRLWFTAPPPAII